LTAIPWTSIASGGSGVNIPITPQSSGRVRILATLQIENNSAPATDMTITAIAQVGATEVLNPFAGTTIPAGTSATQATIPFLFDTDPSLTPVGVTTQIQIQVAASVAGGSYGTNACFVDITELPPVSG
jgi:hypothetical protein